MKKSGINSIGIKKNNRALLLQLICTAKTITRSELSEQSNLSPMTVTNIINEFLQQEIIEVASPSDNVKMPGRTPAILRLSSRSPVIVGIFVAKTYIFGIVGDMSMNLLISQRVAFDERETGDTVLDKIRRLMEVLVGMTDRPILGAGVSTVGIVDSHAGVLRYVTEFFNIRDLPICDYLSAHFPFPIYVNNDMHAAGLCEQYFGVGKEVSSFLYVGVSNGIGAAVISHNELLDACGELGHMSIDSFGPPCPCGGYGCLELYASTPNILRRIEATCGQKLESMEDAVKFCAFDRTAYTILYNAVHQLAFGLNNYLNLVNVPVVVLGHDAYYLPEEMIRNLENWIVGMNVSMYKQGTPPRLQKSAFGENAPVFGSLCIVLEQVFRTNYPLEIGPCSAADPS